MGTMIFSGRKPTTTDNEQDVERIVSILAARDINVSASDAQLAWEALSKDNGGGWLNMWADSDDAVAEYVLRNLVEE